MTNNITKTITEKKALTGETLKTIGVIIFILGIVIGALIALGIIK